MYPSAPPPFFCLSHKWNAKSGRLITNPVHGYSQKHSNNNLPRKQSCFFTHQPEPVYSTSIPDIPFQKSHGYSACRPTNLSSCLLHKYSKLKSQHFERHLGDALTAGLSERYKRHRTVHRTHRYGQMLCAALFCQKPEPEPLPHGISLPLYRQRHGILPPVLFHAWYRTQRRQTRHVPGDPGAGSLSLPRKEAAPPPCHRRGAVPLHRHPREYQDAHPYASLTALLFRLELLYRALSIVNRIPSTSISGLNRFFVPFTTFSSSVNPSAA